MKKRIGIWITIVILIALIFILKDIKLKEIYFLLKEINLFYFMLAFLSCLVALLLWNIRWQNSLKVLVNGHFWFLFEVLLAGIFVNTITPGASVGGEPVRAYYLSRKYKKPKTKFFGCIMAEKLFHLVSFLSFLIFSSLFIFMFIKMTRELRIILEISLVSILLFASLASFAIWKKIEINTDWIVRLAYRSKFIKKRFKTMNKFKFYLDKKIKNIVNSFKDVVANRKKFYFGIFTSLGIWISLFLVSYFLFLSLNTRVSFLSVIIAVTFSYLIGDISLTPGGIGLTESTMFIVYSAMGIATPIAAIVSLLSRMIYYFYALLIGGLSLAHLRYKFK